MALGSEAFHLKIYVSRGKMELHGHTLQYTVTKTNLI